MPVHPAGSKIYNLPYVSLYILKPYPEGIIGFEIFVYPQTAHAGCKSMMTIVGHVYVSKEC